MESKICENCGNGLGDEEIGEEVYVEEFDAL